MESSDDKQFKPDVSQLIPSSSASLDLATGFTLICKQDEATIKPNVSMQETHYQKFKICKCQSSMSAVSAEHTKVRT